MTTRVYLSAARVWPGPPEAGDLPAERVFVNSGEVAEIWVETESNSVPDRGRAVSFALIRPLDIGFERVTGTIERTLVK